MQHFKFTLVFLSRHFKGGVAGLSSTVCLSACPGRLSEISVTFQNSHTPLIFFEASFRGARALLSFLCGEFNLTFRSGAWCWEGRGE